MTTATIEDIGYGAGFTVGIDEAERFVLVGVDRETADYAKMLLEAGIDTADIEEMVERVTCVRCEESRFAAQTNAGICHECQS